jgi:hypothetical protein
MPATDHLGGADAFQAAHRSRSGLQPTVIALQLGCWRNVAGRKRRHHAAARDAHPFSRAIRSISATVVWSTGGRPKRSSRSASPARPPPPPPPPSSGSERGATWCGSADRPAASIIRYRGVMRAVSPIGRMVSPRVRLTGPCGSESRIRRQTAERARVASVVANRSPMQFWGPSPKGK